MKSITAALLFLFCAHAIAQKNESASVLGSDYKRHLSSSILLWMRTDIPRDESMSRWKGPHAQIISANKGLLEYRILHFSKTNTGMWPFTPGVETNIPQARKIDGLADVTLKGYSSLLRGKKQNKLAFKDEVNLFQRSILYAAFPKNSRWYNLNKTNQPIDARSMIFFQMKNGAELAEFQKFIFEELAPNLASTGVLLELRCKNYSPWKESLWKSPNVLHDNPMNAQYQASIIIGTADQLSLDNFFQSGVLQNHATRIAEFCRAVHAYQIEETILFVSNGQSIQQP